MDECKKSPDFNRTFIVPWALIQQGSSDQYMNYGLKCWRQDAC
jgi:hypothetical protein